VHGDFCSWKGLLVVGADNASADGGGNVLCAEPQSGIWMGRTDDLWNLGKPKGWGGPWWETAVTAGTPSDPYLMTGFDGKTMHVSHDSESPVRFIVEVDFMGHGAWHRYTDLHMGAGGYLAHVFPHGFGAHWVRITASENCNATAQLHYT
jgi:hypothetical protein